MQDLYHDKMQNPESFFRKDDLKHKRYRELAYKLHYLY